VVLAKDNYESICNYR